MTTALSAAPPDTATPLRSRWLILAVLCLAQLTVVLDNTVLTVAVPVLTTELDASTTDIQWMINAYALVQCGLLLTAGSAADRYGRRRLLVAGQVLFGVGSLAAGLARSVDQVIAARAGMGVGGALLSTAGLTGVVGAIIDGRERGWTAPPVLGAAGVGVLLLAAFVVWERRTTAPMLDMHYHLRAHRRAVPAHPAPPSSFAATPPGRRDCGWCRSRCPSCCSTSAGSPPG